MRRETNPALSISSILKRGYGCRLATPRVWNAKIGGCPGHRETNDRKSNEINMLLTRHSFPMNKGEKKRKRSKHTPQSGITSKRALPVVAGGADVAFENREQR